MGIRVEDLKSRVQPTAQYLVDSGWSMTDLVAAGFVLLEEKDEKEIGQLIRIASGSKEGLAKRTRGKDRRETIQQAMSRLKEYRKEKQSRPEAKPAQSG